MLWYSNCTEKKLENKIFLLLTTNVNGYTLFTEIDRTGQNAQTYKTKKTKENKQMPESIHTTLKNQSYVVKHQDNEITVPLPKWLNIKDITKIDDVEKWLAGKTPEERLGFYHAGFDSSIIKGRSVTRPKTKIYKKLTDFQSVVAKITDPENWHILKNKQAITKNILIDKENAIERSLAWVPKVKAVPGSGTLETFSNGANSALRLTIEALQDMGMENETIINTLKVKFAEANVCQVLELIAKDKKEEDQLLNEEAESK